MAGMLVGFVNPLEPLRLERFFEFGFDCVLNAGLILRHDGVSQAGRA